MEFAFPAQEGRANKVSCREPSAATFPEVKLPAQPGLVPILMPRLRMGDLADRDQLSDGVSGKRFIACCAINQPGY